MFACRAKQSAPVQQSLVTSGNGRRSATPPSLDTAQFPIYAPAIQFKTAMSAPNDPLEREADRVAEAVIANRPIGTVSSVGAVLPQRKCSACESEEQVLYRKEDGGNAGGQAQAERAASTVSRGGAALTPDQRAYFEPRFSRDLSDVRIHVDASAMAAAGNIGARAYTFGSHIAFAGGEFDSNTQEGRRLLAHEITHTLQQGPAGTRVQRGPNAEIEMPGELAFAADKRKATDVRYARLLAKADAERIRKAGMLSPSDREVVTARLQFFEGDAWQAYSQAIRPAIISATQVEIQMPAVPASKQAQQQAARELRAWKLDMLAQLAAIRSELDAIEKNDLPVLRKSAEDLQANAREAIELARVAEQRAVEARASARRWTRVAGVLKIIGGSIEAIVACPLAETGIGAVGCIHAISSYKSAWDEAWQGEPSPTPVQQSIKAVARPFTSEKTADFIGNLGDAAIGMGTSSYLGVRSGVPATAAAGAGEAAVALDAAAVEESLAALGVEEAERALLPTGAKIWGQTLRGPAKLVTYFKLQGKKLTAGVLSSELPKTVGKTAAQVATEQQGNVIKAFLSFRQQSTTLAKQLGADTLRIEADVVINPNLPPSLLKAGFKEATDSPGTFFKEEPVR